MTFVSCLDLVRGKRFLSCLDLVTIEDSFFDGPQPNENCRVSFNPLWECRFRENVQSVVGMQISGERSIRCGNADFRFR